MVNNSNNINTKKTVTDDVVNPGPGLGQAQKGGGVKSVNGIPLPPTLDLNSDDNKINNNLSPLNVHKNNQGVKHTRKVCRYQKDNHKSEIKRQTIQWPKEKRTNKYQYT
jgi:hypothetical protein